MRYIVGVLISAIAALAMVFSLSVPANASTAFPSDWSCISQCVVQYNSEIGGNVLNIGVGGRAQTSKFSGLDGTRSLCVTYKSNGNAWPNLYNSSGVNVSFGVRSTWDTVCKTITYAGTNLNITAAGSTDKNILVRSVSLT